MLMTEAIAGVCECRRTYFAPASAAGEGDPRGGAAVGLRWQGCHVWRL